jgi:hypothetical protein
VSELRFLRLRFHACSAFQEPQTANTNPKAIPFLSFVPGSYTSAAQLPGSYTSPLRLPVDAVRRVAHARNAPIVRKVFSDACFQSCVILPSKCHPPAQTFAQGLQDALHVDLDTVHAGRGQVLVKLRASVKRVSPPSTENACMETSGIQRMSAPG